MSTFTVSSKNVVETLTNGKKIRYPLSNITNLNDRIIKGVVSDAKVNTIRRFIKLTPNVSIENIFKYVPRRSQLILDQGRKKITNRTEIKEAYGKLFPIPKSGIINTQTIENISKFGNKSATQIVKNQIAAKVRNLVNNIDNDVSEIFDLTQMKLIDIADEIAAQNITINKFISASYDGKTFFAFTVRTIDEINDYNTRIDMASGNVSDAEAYFKSFVNSTITLYSPKIERTRPTGAFFQYTNMTKFDFSKYGIYNEFKADNYKNNCFFNALVASGIPESMKSQLKTLIREIHIPVIKIKEIAEHLKIKIKLYKWDDKCNKSIFKVYGTEGNEYQIALYDNHYFVYDKYNITSFALKNYDEVKDKKDSNYINQIQKFKNKNDSVNYNRQASIDSLKLVRLLIKYKDNANLIKPITDVNELMKTRFYDDLNNVDGFSLDYDIKTNTKITETYKADNSEYFKVWFDFETYVDKKDGNKHKPYLVCWTTEEDKITDIKTARGPTCAKTFINRLPSKEKIMLIAHNLGYDYRFLFPHMYQLKPIIRGNNVLCANGYVYVRNKKIEICLHDSYALITSPLRDFGKMFNLDQGKEVMPYDAYNEMTTYGCEGVTIQDFKAKLNKLNKTNDDIKKDEKILENNLNKWGCIKENGYVNLMKYSEYYCKIDVRVLKEGYLKFRNWMLELTQIDIDNKVSIASLAHEYLVNKGCYEGVLSLSGIPQLFIQKCVVGGRTMTAENEMWHIIGNSKTNDTIKKGNKNIVNLPTTLSDFDAVSLYPSAMYEMPGFLKGAPKVIKVTDNIKNDLKIYDGYFIEIKITSVGKSLKFPLMSYINDKTGVRCFTNEMIGRTIYIDKFALEDAQKYQNIDFEVIRGYYFNEGRNDKIKHVIKHLFDARLKKKSDGNPSQIVYKLIMNASYGKSILKPIDTKIVTVAKNNIDKFCDYNYQNIKSWTDAGNCFIVKLFKPINNHYNNCQVGTEILSYSKRLMNRVMTLAEDMGCNIYYQDTDSMHIESNKIKSLADEFKKIYKTDLVGKNMGQFHTDFTLNKCKDIVADESIFLGKKCYIDSLIGDNKERGYHVRMKGISERALKWTANKEYNGDIMDIYKNLFDGQGVNFDMTCGGLAANFEFTPSMEIKTRANFSRNVIFSKGYD